MVAERSRVARKPGALYRISVAPVAPRRLDRASCSECDGCGELVDGSICDVCDGAGDLPRVGRSRAPWAYWGIPLCGIHATIRRHRGARAIKVVPSSCRVAGCRRCHSARRSSSLEGLRGLQARPGRRWYLWTLTPPDAVTSYAERDEWLRTLRATLAWLVAIGAIDGGYAVVEATEPRLYRVEGETRAWRGDGPPPASWVPTPAPCSSQPCPARLGWWRGQGEAAVAVGEQWDRECRRGGACPCCSGRGWLPVAHLHVHVLMVARPFWYGRDARPTGRPEELRDFDAGAWAERDRSRKSAPLRGYRSGWVARRGGIPGVDAAPEDLRCGMRGLLEGAGLRVFDFQALKDGADGAAAYLSKIVRFYVAKIATHERGAILLGAWMAGRRSSWAFGDPYGLAGSRRASLGWDTLGLSQFAAAPTMLRDLSDHVSRPVRWLHGEAPTDRPTHAQVRRATKQWSAIADNAVASLVLPVGVKSSERGGGDVLPMLGALEVDHPGAVRVMGDGYRRSVIVGGAVVGHPDDPNTRIAAVGRAIMRADRGLLPGGAVGWWAEARAVLDLPPLGESGRARLARIDGGRAGSEPGTTTAELLDLARGWERRRDAARIEVLRWCASIRPESAAAFWRELGLAGRALVGDVGAARVDRAVLDLAAAAAEPLDVRRAKLAEARARFVAEVRAGTGRAVVMREVLDEPAAVEVRRPVSHPGGPAGSIQVRIDGGEDLVGEGREREPAGADRIAARLVRGLPSSSASPVARWALARDRRLRRPIDVGPAEVVRLVPSWSARPPLSWREARELAADLLGR